MKLGESLATQPDRCRDTAGDLVSGVAANPAEILAASRDCEWRQALLDGWVLATQRHRDADWAEALLPLHPDHATLTAALADILPPARFEAYLLALLRESSGGSRHRRWWC